ncbi:hypothetical protein BC834DRAFT_872227 [Gloeopeniophorella convolvens]|nr:hypothetical protein BC834DRAFT_872227 [Gloeopeniophorella convolvens]
MTAPVPKPVQLRVNDLTVTVTSLPTPPSDDAAATPTAGTVVSAPDSPDRPMGFGTTAQLAPPVPAPAPAPAPNPELAHFSDAFRRAQLALQAQEQLHTRPAKYTGRSRTTLWRREQARAAARAQGDRAVTEFVTGALRGTRDEGARGCGGEVRGRGGERGRSGGAGAELAVPGLPF